MTRPAPEVGAALLELSRTYAWAADARDVDAFVGVFASDGQLSVSAVGEPDVVVRVRRGPEQLATVLEALSRYHRTSHRLGRATFDDDDGRLGGEVHCTAEHFALVGAGAENRVMDIRYADEYCVDDAGSWRIAHRLVRIDRIETVPADIPPLASE